MANKAAATKHVLTKNVWANVRYTIVHGELRRRRGRPSKVVSLFQVIAEKLPFDALEEINKHLKKEGIPATGVYAAHDSMGYARYIGRGAIFSRLKSHRKAHPELLYFSFYVVADKKHEREIETLAIRAAGPQLHFNTRKRRIDVAPGNVRDFEAGTYFYERQGKRGRPRSRAT